MSAESPQFSISPLFYDALSAEFLPSIDPRKHTLGRLVAATILKGKYELTQFNDSSGWTNNYGLYTYRPNWAPNNVCRVSVDVVAEDHYAVMRSLRLQRVDETQGLRISRTTDKHSEALAIVQNNILTATYDLELGNKLNVARETVAEAAEEFFA